MRSALRLFAITGLFVLSMACWWTGSSQAASLSGADGVLSASLAIPSVQIIDGAQQLEDEHAARNASPEVRAARVASRVQFEHLSRAQAAAVARRAFSDAVLSVEAGQVPLPAHAKLTRYSSPDTAIAVFPGGRHVMVASLAPMAAPDGAGKLTAIDLSPQASADGFRAVRADVPVRFGSRLDAGATLSRAGVTLVPLGADGAAITGAFGQIEGASVIYPESQVDTDTLLKPVAEGFRMDAILRSQRSPETLRYRLRTPRGTQAREEHGSVVIRSGSRVVARVDSAAAVDAEGNPVPVVMSLRGNLVSVSVEHRASPFRYPILVDPAVEENVGGEGKVCFFGCANQTWGFVATTGFSAEEVEGGVKDYLVAPVTEGEHGTLYYKTQGASRIYKFKATTSFTKENQPPATIASDYMGVVNVHTDKQEGTEPSWIGPYGPVSAEACAEPCTPTAPIEGQTNENEVFYETIVREIYNYTSGRVASGNLLQAYVYIDQEAPPTISSDTTDEAFVHFPETWDYGTNALFGGGSRWVKDTFYDDTVAAFNSTDPGVGVSEGTVTSPNVPGWKRQVDIGNVSPIEHHDTTQSNECVAKSCGREAWRAKLEKFPDGEDIVEAKVTDGVGLTATTTGVVKVDDTAPQELTVGGLPPYNEIGFGTYRMKVSAKDGSGTTPSSGVRLLRLKMDGTVIAESEQGCSPGPCTATMEVPIVGQNYATGKHELAITAVDKAGNTGYGGTTLTIHAAESKPVGPGQVNLASGAFTFGSQDVSIAAPNAPLSVERTYNSRQVTGGVAGPFGSQWGGLSFEGTESLTKLVTGGIVLRGGQGAQTLFDKEGSSYIAPPGDSVLKLVEVSAGRFTLTDGHGDVTTFTVPSGGEGTVLTPSAREVPGHSGTTTYEYETVGGVTRPKSELAPLPAGVASCSPMVAGCRRLTFEYATSTTASGESPSQWGKYTGRLATISYVAYDPESKTMRSTEVSAYAYDEKGRLRAQRNPQITSALETTFGYDAEGHVVAITPPGQQPWLLHYGTIEGDETGGRLLSVSRPPANAAFGNGSAPANTTVPALSSAKPVRGTAIEATQGSWSNTPLIYGYQWERCSRTGSECKPITGAVNPSYTPGYNDEGSTLAVTVTAINASGATASTSAISQEVPQNVFPYVYSSEFGTKGTKTNNLKSPTYITGPDKLGRLIVSDTGNKAVKEFSLTGHYEGAFTNTTFSEPTGVDVAGGINENRSAYVADSGKHQVDFFGETYAGELRYLSATSLESTATLGGLSIRGGAVAVAQSGVTNQVDCILGCEPLTAFGASGSEEERLKHPAAVVLDTADGEFYVTDATANRVLRFSDAKGHIGEYLGSFGETGTKAGQLKEPMGITVDEEGDLWVVDSGNGRVERFTPTGTYVEAFGEPATEKLQPSQLSHPTGITTNGYQIYVVDTGDNRIETWNKGERPQEPPLEPAAPPPASSTATTTIEYHVPASGKGAPYALGTSEAAAWAQTDTAASGTAIFAPDEPMGWPAKDYKRATIYYQDSRDRTVNVAAPTGGISTTEYNATNDVTRTLSADNRAAALAKGSSSAETSKLLDTENTYNSEGTELVSSIGPLHAVALASGGKKESRQHTQYIYDEGSPPEGVTGMLTKKTVGALYKGKEETGYGTETDTRTVSTAYNWQLRKPTTTTVAPAGLALTNTTVYEASGQIKETRDPAGQTSGSPHDTETIYYSTGANERAAPCGGHQEWAGLLCRTQPGHQPETAGLPGLPVTTTTYNYWGAPKTVEEVAVQSGKSEVRTRQFQYDSADRIESTSTTSTVGAAIAPVTYHYNQTTGAIETQTSTIEGTQLTLTSHYNSLGQLTSYVDADGNEATYSYDIDGRPETATDGRGSQTFSYDPTSGLLTRLEDSAAKAFTATYDAEGHMLTEHYPNGMTATRTYNPVGEAVSLIYTKTTNCGSSCTWFSDVVEPTIQGQWLAQESTFSTQSYTYDEAGRLTTVKNTPTGKSCITHVYEYDKDTNRTNFLTKEPTSTGKCGTKVQTEQRHIYDEADRLTDYGTTYNAFGDVTAVSARDAGGSALTDSYYADNQLKTITQAKSEAQPEETIGYALDPAGRTRETTSTGELHVGTTVQHYDGPGNAASWTATGGEWTRNIIGLGGQLAAVQSNGEAPVLQLTNLHGDVIATAYLSETATALASTADTSEFGVPTTSLPPKYSWLGASQIPTELSSGVQTLGPRTYVPTLGRFLQPDPVQGGSANAYAYTYGDPVNTSDPSGQYTIGAASEALLGVTGQNAAQAVAEQAAINAAARHEAECRAHGYDSCKEQEEWQAKDAELNAQEAAMAAMGEEEWEWEEWEEGWEYVSDNHGPGGKQDAHIEPAVLYQPLPEVASGRLSGPTQPQPGDNTHDVSGDGCGDGGYCGGHWVKKSTRSHRHGEAIGGDPWEPFNIFCGTFWWTNPAVAAGCSVGASVEVYSKVH